MRARTTILTVVGTVVLIGLGLVMANRPDQCDGLPRSIGACDSDRPTFDGATCDEVAGEWGRHMDKRVLEVVDGPEGLRGQARSSRLYDVETLVSQLANRHMRAVGLTPSCTPGRFLEVGEGEFSERLVAEVGSIMYDGNPAVDYSEWRARLEEWTTMILSEPYVPAGPAGLPEARAGRPGT